MQSTQTPASNAGLQKLSYGTVHAAEVSLYPEHARMTQLDIKPAAGRLHRLPQKAFLANAALMPEEGVPGGDFAQHVLENMYMYSHVGQNHHLAQTP